MGGIIEDRIFEVLKAQRLTTKQVRMALLPQDERTYGVIGRHLRKMATVRQLGREKEDNGEYVYWNPAEVSRQGATTQ